MKKRWGRRLWAGVLSGLLVFGGVSCSKAPQPAPSAPETDFLRLEDFTLRSVTAFGVAADGSSCVTALESAQKQIGEQQALYFPSGTYLIDRDVQIDVPLKLAANAFFQVESPATLTIAGQMWEDNRPVFTGSGQVRVTHPEVFGFPRWFEGMVQEAARGDTALIQRAVDSLRALYLPNEGYALEGVTIASPITIRGVGAGHAPVFATPSTTALFTIASDEVTIESLLLEMKETKKGSVCFYFDTAGRSLRNVTLSNIQTGWAWQVVTDADSPTHTASHVTLRNLVMENGRDTALWLRDFVGDITLREIMLWRRVHEGTVLCNMPGMIIENADGMVIEHFDVNGEANLVGNGTYPWYDDAQIAAVVGGHGALFQNCKNISAHRVLMEYVGDNGMVFSNCENLDFENVQVFTFNGHGFLLDNVRSSRFSVMKATRDNSPKDILRDNIRMTGCSDVTIESLLSSMPSGEGLLIQNCKGIKLDSYAFLYGNGGYALKDGGGNTGVAIGAITADRAYADKGLISLTGQGVTVNTLAVSGADTLLTQLSSAGEYG